MGGLELLFDRESGFVVWMLAAPDARLDAGGARLNPMTYAIDALRALVLTGWQADPLLRIIAILLAFDALCLAAATLALRRGVR